jgi:hypothetical protein
VLGPPVNVCLESLHSREAIAKMIESFERTRSGDRGHLNVVVERSEKMDRPR